MAIAYDSSLGAAGGNSSTPELTGLTIPSLTDPCIICAIELENTNQTVSSFVLDDGSGGGSQNFTQISTPIDIEAGNFRILFFRLTAATAGSGRRIRCTLSGSGPYRIGAVIYSGVDQTTPIVDPQQNSSASSPASQLNTSARNGSWQIGHSNNPYAGMGAPSNGTNRLQVSTAANVGYLLDSNATIASGGTNTFSWTFGTKMGWQTAILQPTPASGPANLKSRTGNLKANMKSNSGNLIGNMKNLSGNS